MDKTNFKNTKEMKDFIKNSLPPRLDKHIKNIKGIHNLLNKIIIVNDPNCDHLKHDVPMAEQAVWEMNNFISNELINYELTHISLDRDLSLKMRFFASYIDNDAEDGSEFEEYISVNVQLKSNHWKIVAIRK